MLEATYMGSEHVWTSAQADVPDNGALSPLLVIVFNISLAAFTNTDDMDIALRVSRSCIWRPTNAVFVHTRSSSIFIAVAMPSAILGAKRFLTTGWRCCEYMNTCNCFALKHDNCFFCQVEPVSAQATQPQSNSQYMLCSTRAEIFSQATVIAHHWWVVVCSLFDIEKLPHCCVLATRSDGDLGVPSDEQRPSTRPLVSRWGRNIINIWLLAFPLKSCTRSLGALRNFHITMIESLLMSTALERCNKEKLAKNSNFRNKIGLRVGQVKQSIIM